MKQLKEDFETALQALEDLFGDYVLNAEIEEVTEEDITENDTLQHSRHVGQNRAMRVFTEYYHILSRDDIREHVKPWIFDDEIPF